MLDNVNVSLDINRAFNDAGKGLYDLFLFCNFKDGFKKELEKACYEGNEDKIHKMLRSVGVLSQLNLVHVGQFNNIQQILNKTQPLIQNSKAEQIDPKKRDKILEAIKFEYDDEAQGLWAKLIAGEINHPGSYSVRTIEVLKTLTKEEAKLFQDIAPYISFCWGDTSILGKNFWRDNSNSSLNFKKQLKLENAGLLASISLGHGGTGQYISLTEGIEETFGIEFPKSRALLHIRGKMNSSTTFSIPSLILTEEAKEIFQLIDLQEDNQEDNQLDPEYLKHLCQYFQHHFEALDIVICKNKREQADGSYKFESMEKIEVE